jgi:hypothetical protein
MLSGCDHARDIGPGRTEADVRRALGTPSRIESDKQEMQKYFFGHEEDRCLTKAVRVLFYDRWIRDDLSISFDATGRVLCVSRAQMIFQK